MLDLVVVVLRLDLKGTTEAAFTAFDIIVFAWPTSTWKEFCILLISFNMESIEFLTSRPITNSSKVLSIAASISLL